jgi:hypothetical protein
MHNLRKVICTCNQNIRKWPTNPRIYMIALFIFCFVNIYEKQLNTLCKMVSVSINPWLFPFLGTEYFIRMVIMIGVVLLFCDAPFIDSTQPYVIARSGKYQWVTGQIFYIFAASAIYFLFVIFVSVLCVAPNLTFSLEWGKIIGTLAQTSAGAQFGCHMNFYTIFMLYSPLQAMLLSFFMSWLCGVFLGLVIFTLDMYFKRVVGVLAATAFVMLDLFANNPVSGPPISGFLFFSPVSWSNIELLDTTGTSTNPKLQYAIIVMIIIIAVLSTISIRAIKKKNIDVLPPV